VSRINVNPTRMELSKLKKSLSTAKRGHKLLKDKRDEMMKRFLDIVRENKEVRIRVENKLSLAQRYMQEAAAVMSREAVQSALMIGKYNIEVEVNNKNVMSVAVPEFRQKSKADVSDIIPYGFADTSAQLDYALEIIADTVDDMLRLAECEKTVALLSAEIERTRRRVNALEYILIPDYEETVKYISMKLEENQRGNTTRLLKVKDLVLNEKYK